MSDMPAPFDGRLTPELREQFDRDGFLLLPGLLNPHEVESLSRIARLDHQAATSASRADGEGGSIRLHVENELTDDIYSAICRSERIVDLAEGVLGEEVYHWHHKLILKEPRVGGAWAWHQDYGYWYHNGCLEPRLVSCLLAIDRATRANGCLQVVRGSHRLGRLEHGKVGDQTGVADAERLEAILARHELVHCELEPGGAVLFHSNLLHRSDQNHSDHPRWAFICCYNARSNSPYKATRHPSYSRLEKWPHEQIGAVAQRRLQ